MENAAYQPVPGSPDRRQSPKNVEGEGVPAQWLKEGETQPLKVESTAQPAGNKITPVEVPVAAAPTPKEGSPMIVKKQKTPPPNDGKIYPADFNASINEPNTANMPEAKSPGMRGSVTNLLKSELETLNELEFEAASEEKAIKHRDLKAFTMKDENGEMVEYPLELPEKELGKYGIGIQLYFTLLKFATIIFFIMSLIAIIPIANNATAGGLTTDQIQSIFDQYTIANQIDASNGTKGLDEDGSELDSMETRLELAMLPDIFYSLAFFLFVIYYRFLTRKLIKDTEEEYISTSDYSLEIKGFPSSGVTKEELGEFLFQFGETVEISFVRDFGESVAILKDLGDKEREKLIESHRLKLNPKRGTETMAKIDKAIAAKKVSLKTEMEQFKGMKIEDFPVLKAFVIFENIEDRNKTLRTLDDVADDGLFWCCCPRRHDPNHIFRGKHKIIGKIPDEPSGILWENLGKTIWERRSRMAGSYFAIVCVLFISFFLLMMATFFQGIQTQYCEDFKALNDTMMNAFDLTVLRKNGTAMSCFCDTQSAAILATNSTQYNACYYYHMKRLEEWVVNSLSGFIISNTGTIVASIFIYLADFCKFQNITELTGVLLTNTFIVMYINIALIPTLAMGQFNGVIPTIAILANTPFANTDAGVNDSTRFPDDFNRSWYLDVGGKITSAMLFNIWTPHMISLAKNLATKFATIVYVDHLKAPLKEYIIRPFKRIVLRNTEEEEEEIKLQMDLYKEMDHPEFDFKYPQIMCTIYICLSFSSGMPLILIFGFAAFFTLYCTEKYRLLRASSRPPQYDAKLATQLNTILPIALILHLIIAVGVYGTDSIFPVNVYTDSFDESKNSSDITETIDVNERIAKAVVLFVILLIVGALFVFEVVVLNVLFALLRIFRYICLCGCFCPKKDDDKEIIVKKEREIRKFSEEYIERLQFTGLCSYDILKNEKYRTMVMAIDLYAENPDADLEKLKYEEPQKGILEMAGDMILDKVKDQAMDQLKDLGGKAVGKVEDKAKEYGKDVVEDIKDKL